MRLRTRLGPPPFWILGLLLGFGLIVYALAFSTTSTQAAPIQYQGDKPSNDFCLACHQEQGIALTLGSESLPVTINPIQFGLSVHAEEGIACVDCHANISDYPHPDVKEKSVRAFSLASRALTSSIHLFQTLLQSRTAFVGRSIALRLGRFLRVGHASAYNLMI